MSKESTQAALGKFAEAVNTGKFELLDEVVASECVDHDPAEGQVPGPDGYRFFFSLIGLDGVQVAQNCTGGMTKSAAFFFDHLPADKLRTIAVRFKNRIKKLC